MTATDLMRRGATAAVTAGALGILGDLYHVTQDRNETSALFKLHGVVLIAALICALFALVALQLRPDPDRRAPAGVGFWLAFVGTVLVAGDIFYEVVVQPGLAGIAPEFLDADLQGWQLLAVAGSYALFGAGWLLTGIGVARSKLIGAAPGIVLAVGGLIGFTPLPGSYVLWSLGLILTGLGLRRLDRSPASQMAAV